MQYNGKEAESVTFRGATPEEANAALLNGSNGRNILNADLQTLQDGTYAIVAIFEKKSDRQLLVEG